MILQGENWATLHPKMGMVVRRMGTRNRPAVSIWLPNLDRGHISKRATGFELDIALLQEDALLEVSNCRQILASGERKGARLFSM